MTGLKDYIFGAFCVVGIFVGNLFGGWDVALQTLILFMVVDFIMGHIVAGVFQNSPKTESGTISSSAGWRGLAKKGVSLLIILIATQLDILSGTNFVRIGVIFPFIANELTSIIENAGLMGVPIPKVVTDVIELLKKQMEEKTDD